jgi:hypothetical protein
VEAPLGLSRPERGSGLEAREKKERGWEKGQKAFLFMKKIQNTLQTILNLFLNWFWNITFEALFSKNKRGLKHGRIEF